MWLDHQHNVIKTSDLCLLPLSGSSRTKQNLTKHAAHGAAVMSQQESGAKYATVVIWLGGGRRYW